MTMHRYHPDPDRDDPPSAILWDDCERCDEHATQLVSLDSSNCRRLVHLVLGVEVYGVARYQTHAEAKAGRNVHHAACVIASANRSSVADVLGVLVPIR